MFCFAMRKCPFGEKQNTRECISGLAFELSDCGSPHLPDDSHMRPPLFLKPMENVSGTEYLFSEVKECWEVI